MEETILETWRTGKDSVFSPSTTWQVLNKLFWTMQTGLSVKLSEPACFVFRLEQHQQGNTLTDE
jgi:hypothetical protein